MSDNRAHGGAGPDPAQYRLPLRGGRDATPADKADDSLPPLTKAINSIQRRFPESLHFPQSAIRRLRSPTESSMSTLSSIPDSSTTYSLSTLASPVSSSFPGEVPEPFAVRTLDSSRSSSRILHRHRGSSGTCSTLIDDEEDALFMSSKKELDLEFHASNRDEDADVKGEDVPLRSVAIVCHGLDVVLVLIRLLSPVSEATVEEQPPPTGIRNTNQVDSDDSETFSTTDEDHSHDDANTVLDYTLQLVYGLEASDIYTSRPRLQNLTHQFLSSLGDAIREDAQDTDQSQNTSSERSSCTLSQGADGLDYQKGEKRKKADRPDKDSDDLSDGEGTGQLPVKRLKPTPRDDDNLRLSCPYRKRNPKRFNVRDHHSCAMTYFPKFAELRYVLRPSYSLNTGSPF